jgi:hypothetical protein
MSATFDRPFIVVRRERSAVWTEVSGVSGRR